MRQINNQTKRKYIRLAVLYCGYLALLVGGSYWAATTNHKREQEKLQSTAPPKCIRSYTQAVIDPKGNCDKIERFAKAIYRAQLAHVRAEASKDRTVPLGEVALNFLKEREQDRHQLGKGFEVLDKYFSTAPWYGEENRYVVSLTPKSGQLREYFVQAERKGGIVETALCISEKPGDKAPFPQWDGSEFDCLVGGLPPFDS